MIYFKTICPGWKKLHVVSALIVFCLLIPRSTYGTEILLIITSGGVVVFAADSLIVQQEGLPLLHGCKIEQTGNIFWAAGGETLDDYTGFDIRNFFNTGIKNDRSLQQNLDAIGNRLTMPLQRELPIIKARNPRYYATVLKSDAFLSLYAVKPNGKVIEAYSKEIKIVNGKIKPIPATTCDPRGGSCILMTAIPEVKRFLITKPPSRIDIPLIDTLMEVGRSSDPRSVGPPYSILGITPQGPTWIRQNDCKNIEESSKATHH